MEEESALEGLVLVLFVVRRELLWLQEERFECQWVESAVWGAP